MKKKIVSICLIIILLSTSIPAKAELDLDAHSALLMDYNSGEIIYAINENDQVAPASITKIMTLLLVMESLNNNKIKLEDQVFISEKASKTGGTSVYLDEGEIQTIENLIKAVSVRSANDAAVALAEHISGTEEEFVKLMNKRAKELGAKNTMFSNSTGLPSEEQYITAYDVAILSRELLNHGKILDYMNIYMEDIEVGKSKKSIQTMVNTNKLIKEYQGANGIKTGFTKEAQHCISASAIRDNLHLIAVVMKSTSSKARFDSAKVLLDYGFSNYKSEFIANKGDTLASIEVDKGKENKLDLVLEKDAYMLLNKDNAGNIEKTINTPKIVNAPVEKDSIIGELILKVNEKEVGHINLISKKNIEKANIFDSFKTVIKNYIIN